MKERKSGPIFLFSIFISVLVFCEVKVETREWVLRSLYRVGVVKKVNCTVYATSNTPSVPVLSLGHDSFRFRQSFFIF